MIGSVALATSHPQLLRVTLHPLPTPYGHMPRILLYAMSTLTALVIMALSAVLFPTRAEAATPDANGGGFADAGIEGAYYANPDLAGEPTFLRRDVRIDFDWGDSRLIGGSTAEPYRGFRRDSFSVRWTGRVVARFDESYTFLGDAEDGIRIRIRAQAETPWTTLVDRWEQAGAFQSEPLVMRAGVPYDIEVDYRQRGGGARCSLRWRSPSTGTEVIDPVRQQGLNVTHFQWQRFLWADGMKSARYGQGAEHVDASAWPTQSDVEVVLGESHFANDTEMTGTYLVRFAGQAQVRQDCCVAASFFAGGRAYHSKLPKAAGYDAGTNKTTALMTLDGSRSMLFFDDTQRTPSTRDDGVSEIKFMRPAAQGSTEHHRPDEIAYRPFAQVLRNHFTVVRMLGMSGEQGGEWSKRTRPGDAFFIGEDGRENWEYLVMLANETGRDLYITIPIAANDEYLEKLALLLRYGSDGREPYRQPEAEPVYPPLNPNLRLYVELDNEIWNWAFATTQAAQQLSKVAHDAATSTWEIVDYDGAAGDPQHMRAVRRWHAVRTVEASNAFRRVWGDKLMGPRVRMLLEYQYDNYQDTALASLDFIDDYFNNRTWKHVSDPHPVSHFLWGAGGAAYYGLENSKGDQTETRFGDPSFETPSLSPGTAVTRPKGTAWRFEGASGLIRPADGSPTEGFANASAPSSGAQAAFLRGRGSFGQRIRFAAAGTYSVSFHAAGSGEGWPGYLPFDILVDGRKVSPRDQVDTRVSPESSVIGGWGRGIDSLEGEWGSAAFRIEEPGPHEVTFVGRGEATDYLLVDDIRIASADAILESGFAKGEAQGQEGRADFAFQLRAQATYARSFGLQVVAYEAGWSLGGDLNQSPLQNWSKLSDPRAQVINDDAIELWDRSGSFLPVWGVYEYWPTYDFADAERYPIMQSFREAGQGLRHEATHGRPLPATLRVDDSDWSYRSGENESCWRKYVPWMRPDTAEWHAWMLIAPKGGARELLIKGRGKGRVAIEVDGELVGEFDGLEGPPQTVRATLTQGPHSLRVVLLGGDIELGEVQIR
jgi:hypothetical protein